MQTDAKTFADKFSYPICNLCGIMPLYSLLYQRLIKFMTSTSLSAEKGVTDICDAFFDFRIPKNIPKVSQGVLFYCKKLQGTPGCCNNNIPVRI